MSVSFRAGLALLGLLSALILGARHTTAVGTR